MTDIQDNSPITRSAVSTKDAPEAVGPYSQGMVYNGVLYCSGQMPLLPDTGEIVPGDIATRTRQCLLNLQAVCAAANANLASAVRVTIYLTDFADFPEVNREYAKFFAEGAPPARTTIGVAALPKSVDIEIDAFVPVAGA